MILNNIHCFEVYDYWTESTMICKNTFYMKIEYDLQDGDSYNFIMISYKSMILKKNHNFEVYDSKKFQKRVWYTERQV